MFTPTIFKGEKETASEHAQWGGKWLKTQTNPHKSAILEWISFERKRGLREYSWRQSERTTLIWSRLNPPLLISISKRPPEAREAIDTGARGKAKIIGCDGCSDWAQGQMRRAVNRKWWRRDSRVNPREKPRHPSRADKKFKRRRSSAQSRAEGDGFDARKCTCAHVDTD